VGQRENLIISLEIFSTNWKQNYNLSEVVGYSKICKELYTALNAYIRKTKN